MQSHTTKADTGGVLTPRVQIGLGVVWVVLGVIIALSPSLGDSETNQHSPHSGWLIAAAALFMIVVAVRRLRNPPAESPARPAARQFSRRHKVLLIAGNVVVLLGAITLIGVGLSRGQVGLTAYALLLLSFAAAGMLMFAQARQGR